MLSPKLIEFADLIVNYSLALKKGEKVLIDVYGTGEEIDLAQEVVRKAYEAGALPFIQVNRHDLLAELYSQVTEEQLKLQAEWDLARMKQMDAYVAIRGGFNTNEWNSIPKEKLNAYSLHWYKPVHMEQRIEHTRWVVMRFPTPAMAQDARMGTKEFRKFYEDVCVFDYAKLSKAMDPLVELMNKTDKVRIVGPGTDLTFSIKGIPAVKSDGHYNLPDGEVFTAPVRDSVNGVVSFNSPAIIFHQTLDGIKLTFENGKVVKGEANQQDLLDKLLNTDEGSRYLGEFGIGVHPIIAKPMKDILFDEKIGGSFHLALGNAYTKADNGNRSAIHEDIVCIQRPEFGGGEMYFDDVLVRKDGQFVLPELKGLNY